MAETLRHMASDPHRYFADETERSEGILNAAVELLRIRRKWLDRGEGGMTEEEEPSTASKTRRWDGPAKLTTPSLMPSVHDYPRRRA